MHTSSKKRENEIFKAKIKNKKSKHQIKKAKKNLKKADKGIVNKNQKLENKKLGDVLEERNIRFKKANNDDYANSLNAQDILKDKLKTAESLPTNPKYIRNETTLDGKIRYFKKEKPSKTPGKTRGSAYVMQYDTKTGNLRAWMESYYHQGHIIRINEKNINGLKITKGPHTPPTGKDYDNFNIKKPKG